MNILKDVSRELWSMFVADARLTLALLALVAATGTGIRLSLLPPFAAGIVLTFGTVIVLILAIRRFARSIPRR
jgi:hypothetical protein